MELRCPVCGKYKYWDKGFRKGHTYIQCQNCWSIMNKDTLLERVNRKESIKDGNIKHREKAQKAI